MTASIAPPLLLALAVLGDPGPGGERAAFPPDRGYWTAALGVFDVDDEQDGRAFAALVEHRFEEAFLHVRPAAGLLATADESLLLYGGLRYDWRVGGGWTITPGWAAGLYEEGDGLDLGSTLLFRSQIEVWRDVGSRLRVGLAAAHVSNGGIEPTNPGSESVMFTFAYSP